MLTGGYPAGCDSGSCGRWFGDMIYIQGKLVYSIRELNPDLNYKLEYSRIRRLFCSR
jgi:hypothetical protein